MRSKSAHDVVGGVTNILDNCKPNKASTIRT